MLYRTKSRNKTCYRYNYCHTIRSWVATNYRPKQSSNGVVAARGRAPTLTTENNKVPYIVFVEGRSTPRVIQPDLETATTEAHRLQNLEHNLDRQVLILEITSILPAKVAREKPFKMPLINKDQRIQTETKPSAPTVVYKKRRAVPVGFA